MNKVYFRFDKSLSVANLVPTIIDYKTPKTEFVLQNYKELKYDTLKLVVFKEDINVATSDFIDGVATVRTENLNADYTISLYVKDGNYNKLYNLPNKYYNNKLVFDNEDTAKYSGILTTLMEEVERLSARVNELEKDKEYEII